MTRAPESVSTPWHMTVMPPPHAPMRLSSGTCIKRFSKTVYSDKARPFRHRVQRATNCARISVAGNAGCGAVRTLTAFGRLPCMSRLIQSSPISISVRQHRAVSPVPRPECPVARRRGFCRYRRCRHSESPSLGYDPAAHDKRRRPDALRPDRNTIGALLGDLRPSSATTK